LVGDEDGEVGERQERVSGDFLVTKNSVRTMPRRWWTKGGIIPGKKLEKGESETVLLC
jgi:hypothetical protein